ncbi:DUF1345 domain-containing protein [Microvirga lotononidis]|uniref:Putative membrane protein n=1 Tax=Microvirga lotononidis TaxID=864069 RepID=I4YZC9_9HYPH|nr:DUF1345 domain-containing protein [Microvirga lotononidis]EIM29321.1 putative membrane protein [Microvirga lotononidis]WQO29146.1 DUF1345 domain-containing protein [Microvirga lotononidis]
MSIINQIRLRPRLLGAALVVLLVFAALPSSWQLNSRVLVAWDLGVVFYLVLAGIMAARSSTAMMQNRAAQEDEAAAVVLALTLAASIASLAAIAVELAGIRDGGADGKGFHLSIAGITILCSWFFVHTIYAIHYAHEYYGDKGERQGLAFPHKGQPDYWDFLYFAFNLGAAAQTSDVVIVSKRMRRLALAHTILSFLFNTTILALAVNVGAGML